MVLSLSGPPAALGKQALDGFQLGLKALGGKFAGREVETVVVDDELKPDLAITKVQALIDRDKVDFVVGPIFSNVLQAIIKPVTDQKIFLISPNAGPSSFAGKACNPYFFVTSYENDRIHAASGTLLRRRAISASSCSPRITRPARTRSKASSSPSRARSWTRSTRP